MRVLVTGATGFIGSAVARRLAADGHSVLAAVRDAAAIDRLRALGIPAEPVTAGLDDPRALSDAAKNCDAVVHLAFEHGGDLGAAVAKDRRAVAAFASALRGTDKSLVVTSATGMLGSTGAAPVDEDHSPPLDFPLAVRRQVEVDLQAEGMRGVRASAVRVPILVHAAAGGGPLARLVATARRTGKSCCIGAGENQLPCVQLDDLAELYLSAIKAAPAGSVYNANGSHTSMHAFAAMIGRALDVPLEHMTRDEAVAHFGPFFAMLLSLNNHVSNARARSELDWKPYRGRPTLEEDIIAMVRSGAPSR